MMDRRTFNALIAAAVTTRARPVSAQQPMPLPSVGIVNPTLPIADTLGSDPNSPLMSAFVHGLRDLGWVDGRTVGLVRHSAEGDQKRAPDIFADLLAHRVDTIMLGGARWLHEAALLATRTIPIVAVFQDDPVAAGLIGSLARPGGNLTGVTLATGPEFQSKRLQLLVEIAPRIARVAFLAPPEVLEQYRDVARPAGTTVIPIPHVVGTRYEEAFATVLGEKVDALMVGGGVHFGNAKSIGEFAAANRLPTIFPWREGIGAGGLMSYGTNVGGVWRQCARLVDKFLRGARIGDVPVEQPTNFELIINLRTAKALDLTPPPFLLARADEVIE
jgi:putative tryptophan/tyrosine transport system substrate-binding protein